MWRKRASNIFCSPLVLDYQLSDEFVGELESWLEETSKKTHAKVEEVAEQIKFDLHPIMLKSSTNASNTGSESDFDSSFHR